MPWTLDTAHTTVGFSAKHLGLSTVRGHFTRFAGEVELDDSADPTTGKGRVEIDAASIDTGNEQRDTHLRSADFFDVENHPKIVFESRSVRPAGADTFEIEGDLTIKGITKPVTVQYEHGGTMTDPYGNLKVGGSMTATISRGDWDLKWNVPLGGGGVLVGEKIKIEVDGQLAKTAEAVRQEVEVEAKGEAAARSESRPAG